MQRTTDTVWQQAMDALSTMRVTLFLGLTLGIANNDNTEDDRAKEEMGGGGGGWGDIEMSTTHDTKSSSNWVHHLSGHFCMTGKRLYRRTRGTSTTG